MIRLLQTELYKIFRRPRTYISFAFIFGICLLIQLAFWLDGEAYISFVTQGLEGFTFEGKIIHGYMVTYVILQMLLVHVPLLVALVAGDVLAGEANLGTLRLLLSKPIARWKLVMAKFLASIGYSLLLLFWLALVGLLVSLLIFGEGDMLNMKSGEIVLILKNDILWRYFAAFGFAALAMTCVASLALFLSSLADNSIGPIVGTIVIILLLLVISNIGLPLFDKIKPFLFTTHMIGWKGFFNDPVPYAAIGRSALVLGVYTILFLGTTIFYFNRKDIQS